MLTVDIVPVIVSKLLSMKRPRRRRKVSAARRRSRNPVHDRSRQKCRLLTSPLWSIVITSSCTVDSNSYTPQLIAKYATTNISGMASYVSATLRMRLLPRRRSSSHKERDDEHFGHGVAHAVARNPRGSRLYFSSRIRREPRWRVCPENTILIHAQRKGTRARAFRGVAVSTLVSGG